MWAGPEGRYDQPVPGLRGDWIVQFTPGTKLKTAAGPLTALLLCQEQADPDKSGKESPPMRCRRSGDA